MKRAFALLMSLTLLFSMIPTVAVSAAPSTEGLLLYYKFDGDLTDSSGNSRNGTLNGSNMSYIEGMDNRALKLNGAQNTTVTVPSFPSQSAITIASWIRIDSLANTYNGIYHTNSWTSGAIHYHISGSSGKLTVGVNGNSDVSSDYAFSKGSLWTHTAMVYDSADKTVKFYINGKLDSTRTIGSPVVLNGNTALISGYGDENRGLDGALDDYRIYGRALNGAEILELLNGIDPPEPPELPELPSSDEFKYRLDDALGFNENTYKTIPKATGTQNNWWDGSVSANGEIGFIQSGDPNEDVFIFNNTKIVSDGADFYETPVLHPVLDAQKAGAVTRANNNAFPWITQTNTYSNEQYGTGWGTTWPRPYQPAAQYRIKNNDYTQENSTVYNRYTNFETGEVGVQWKDKEGNEWNRRSFASRSDDIIVTYIESPDEKDLNLTLTIDNYRQISNANNVTLPIDYVVTQKEGKVVAYGLVGKYEVANRKGSKNVKERLFAHGGWGTATQIITDGTVGYQANTQQISGTTYNNPTITVTGTKSLMLITKVERQDSGCDTIADVKALLYDKLVADIQGIVNEYNVTSSEKSYQDLLAPHEELHGDMFNNVRIDLCATEEEIADRSLTNTQLIAKQNSDKSKINKAFLERVYNNGRFGLICSSGYQTARLGGIWNGQYSPQWSGDFTLDANTNLQISGMNTGNMQTAGQGYINFIVRMVSDWESDAKNVYGMTDAIKAPPRVDGTGASGSYHFLDGYPHIYVNGITDWLILPIFEYWQCYGNQPIELGKDIDLSKGSYNSGTTIADVLDLSDERVAEINASGYMDLEQDILLPLLVKTMNFWLQFADERFYTDGEGKHHLNDGTTLSQAVAAGDEDAVYLFTPGYSPENTPQGGTGNWGENSRGALAYNTAFDISAAYDTLYMARTMIDVIDPSNRDDLLDSWASFEQYIPPYKYTSDGAFKEWAADELGERYRHRHDSHAYPAWPGYEAQDDLEIRKGLSVAMDKRSEAYNNSEAAESHGPVHKLLIEARLKRASEVDRILKYLLTSNYQNASMTTNHNANKTSSFCTDSAHGIFGGVNESLLYSDMNVIEILPALIPTLDKGSITGLRARNNTQVDSIVWNKREMSASVTLTPDADKDTLKVMCGLGMKSAKIKGETQTILVDDLGRKYVEVQLVTGNTVTVDFELEEQSITISTEKDLDVKLTSGDSVQFNATIYPSTSAHVGVNWFVVDAETGNAVSGVTISSKGLLNISKTNEGAGKTFKVYATTSDGVAQSNELFVELSLWQPIAVRMESEDFDYGFGYYVIEANKASASGNAEIGYVGGANNRQCVFKYGGIDFTDLKSINLIRTYDGAVSVKFYIDLDEVEEKTYFTNYNDNVSTPQDSRRYQLSDVLIDDTKLIATGSIASTNRDYTLELSEKTENTHDLYVVIQVTSGTYGGNYDYMFLNYASVNMDGLLKSIAKAQALNQADYTADSWVVLADALVNAQAVMADADATQAVIDAAAKSIDNAIDALVKIPVIIVDKKALDSAIDEAKALNEADYTAESWSRLRDALANAIFVQNDADATQAEVDIATAAIKEAIAALEEPTDPGETVDVKKLTIKGAATVKRNKTVELTVVVDPTDATFKDVTWTSLTPDTATVDANGVITGNKAGFAIIEATAHNGVSTQYTIRVIA
ncbi:LamG-like jellyroll fold domain-containing protein [Oscillospiraceae bacterium MB08-C2-2]|nr:LamG-like jellyroll fold domain-containing protein [Oscillospiraceae bacterium MB08-C2-2]